MEARNDDGAFDSRVTKNIRVTARRLAWRRAVPGMEADDFEQDLSLHLHRRRGAFDPNRASFATFADRVVANRSRTLSAATLQIRAERSAISLDAPFPDADGEPCALVDLLPDQEAPNDEAVAVRLDVGGLVRHLPPRLVECCGILLAGNISREASAMGIHRSTVHEQVKDLRARATKAGLAVYLEARPDTSLTPQVSGSRQALCLEGSLPMTADKKPRSVRLLICEDELWAWSRAAEAGTTLEYHRGNLASDRLLLGSRLPSNDRAELDRVAKAALAIAESGHGHLVQRRHGSDDYSYLLVASEKGRTATGCP